MADDNEKLNNTIEMTGEGQEEGGGQTGLQTHKNADRRGHEKKTNG